jgi:MFS family permease
LGIGESVAYPCICKLLAQRTPEHERGRANGLVAAGQALGPTFGTLVGGLAMARFGWRAAFMAFGIVSLTWLVPWFLVTRGGKVTSVTSDAGRPVSHLLILKNRSLWGASLGQFCSTYAYYFVLSWLPIYLVKTQGFSVTEMAQIGAGIYAVHAASAALTGWLSDRWIIAGASPNRVRKSLLVTGLIGVVVLMIVCANADSTLAIVLLVATAAVFGTQTPNLFAIAQTLGGPRAAGQWMGVQNLIGNLSGVVAPLVTGFVVDRTGKLFLGLCDRRRRGADRQLCLRNPDRTH